MAGTTYELIIAPCGAAAFRCLLCGGESSGSESVQRLYCVHCSWFHEPLDEDRLNMSRHLQAAVGEAQAALEIAEALGDDAERINQLKTALHGLRRTLSRA
jgi:hypothetical protein